MKISEATDGSSAALIDAPLAAGADPTATQVRGQNALDLALVAGAKDLVAARGELLAKYPLPKDP